MALQRATASSILDGQRWFYTKLQADARNAASHKNMAALLMGQNRVEMAVRHYEAALKINATDPSLSNDMGVALMSLGKNDRAREFFQQALDLSPNGEYHAAHTNMAALFAKKGDWRHALKHCQEALRPGGAGQRIGGGEGVVRGDEFRQRPAQSRRNVRTIVTS